MHALEEAKRAKEAFTPLPFTPLPSTPAHSQLEEAKRAKEAAARATLQRERKERQLEQVGVGSRK